ncbi:MAG: nucleoside deaminase [Vicinamibacteria bacterium]
MKRLERNRKFMEAALEEGYRGIARADGGPFGAVIVKSGTIVARGHNEVLKTGEPTRHAEMCAIRKAASWFRTHLFLGAEIYSTTEPCVMCFAAIHWARMRRIYFGTTVKDVKRLGFNELAISNRRLSKLGGSPVEIVPNFLREECLELLEAWRRLPTRKTY